MNFKLFALEKNNVIKVASKHHPLLSETYTYTAVL